MSEQSGPIRPRRRVVAAEDGGTANVAHSITKSKVVTQESAKDFSIPNEVTPADPAYVSIGLGFTESLGQFEFLRLDARVTLPCGTSDAEVKAAAARAGELAAAFIEEERQKAMGTEGITA